MLSCNDTIDGLIWFQISSDLFLIKKKFMSHKDFGVQCKNLARSELHMSNLANPIKPCFLIKIYTGNRSIRSITLAIEELNLSLQYLMFCQDTN